MLIIIILFWLWQYDSVIIKYWALSFPSATTWHENAT